MDPRLSPHMCSRCNSKLENLSQIVQVVRGAFTTSDELSGDSETIFQSEIGSNNNIFENNEIVTNSESDFSLYDIIKVETPQFEEEKSQEVLNSRFALKECFVMVERLNANHDWSTSIDLPDGSKTPERLYDNDENKVTLSFNCSSKAFSRQIIRSKCNTLGLINAYYYCDFCSYKTNNKNNLARHIGLRHFYEKSHCKICKRVFHNPTKLNLHLRTHAKDKPAFKCLICESVFGFYVTLRRHVENLHPTEKKKIEYSCDFCGVVFFTKTRLEFHMKKDHIGPFKCLAEDCEKRFADNRTRRSHMILSHKFDIEVNQLSFLFHVQNI